MRPNEGRVGTLLREWRALRNHSQLSLALRANVSARHVSFIESGRAQPSRDMILQLSDALDVPLRDRNALLSAGGFAPVFSDNDLNAPGMQPVREALARILQQQEPHPAVVMDRHWNILSTNSGAVQLFSQLIDLAAVSQPANVLRLMFDPAGLRPYVANWDAVARSLLVRVTREAVCGVPDEALSRLLDELSQYAGVPSRASLGTISRSLLPVVPVTFSKGSFSASYFSTVTTLGTPQDVTLQEIRIECFFPIEHGEALNAR